MRYVAQKYFMEQKIADKGCGEACGVPNEARNKNEATI